MDNPLEKTASITYFGRYHLVKQLGRGGMGIVYLAHDPNLNRQVALKQLSQIASGDKERSRFLREASVMARLDHPHIVKVFDVGEEMGQMFFTMELVDGVCLSDFAKQNIPLTCLLQILVQVAEAVHYAHGQGVVHRDLKPGNIMITKDGTPKVMDFGLAKEIGRSDRLSKSRELLGTPHYMSPEQAEPRKGIDSRTDVYALGMILYEMVAGRLPFGGTAVNILYQIKFVEPPPPSTFFPRLSKDLETICLKALEKEKDKRYQSAHELAEELSRYLRSEPIQARRYTPLHRGWKWCMRHRLPLSAAVATLFLVATFFAYQKWWAPAYLNIDSKAMIDSKWQSVTPQIIVDGRRLARGVKRFAVTAGDRRLRLELDEYEPLDFTVQATAGKETRLEKEMSPQNGRLTVRVSPGEAEATLRHIRSGKVVTLLAPFYDQAMSSGEYEAVFRKHNHFTEKRGFAVSAARTTSIHVDMLSVLVWQREIAEEQELQTIALADIDRNGEIELLCMSPSGRITAYDLASHRQLWSLAGRVTPGPFPLHIRDVDKDGVDDLILGQHHCLRVVNGKTRQEMWRLPRFWGSNFAFVDANRDGYDDLVLARAYDPLECRVADSGRLLWENKNVKIGSISNLPEIAPGRLLCAGNGKIHELDVSNGHIARSVEISHAKDNPEQLLVAETSKSKLVVWSSLDAGTVCLDWPSLRTVWQHGKHAWPGACLTLADVDGDGEQEVLEHTDRMRCLRLQNGSEVWSFASNNMFVARPPTVADLDGDGRLEVVAHTQQGDIYTLDARSGEKIGEFACGAPVKAVILFDVDHDGEFELLALARNSVYCLRYRPDARMRVFAEDRCLQYITPAIYDFDGDGVPEIVTGNSSGDVYCLDSRSWREKWRFNIGESVDNSPVIADINGDSKPEIVVQGASNLQAWTLQHERLWEFQVGLLSHKMPLVADVNQDGTLEIIAFSGQAGQIFCVDGCSGRKLWQSDAQRIQMMPWLGDIDNDGKLELLVTCTMQFPDGGRFYCFRASDGKLKWQTIIPFGAEGGCEIALADIDNDRCLEIFVGQIGGWISCIHGKSGNALWHRRLRGGDLRCFPQVGDFDNDGRYDVIVTTANNDIHRLKASTGEIVWWQELSENAGSVMDTDFLRGPMQLLAFHADLDGDGCDDFVLTNEFHSFHVFSGKDGHALGFTRQFGTLSMRTLLQDADGDHCNDLLFVDRQQRLVCIRDFPGYVRHLTAPPRFVANFYQDADLLALSHCERLLRRRDYRQLQKELGDRTQAFTHWPHRRHLYQAMCHLQSGQEREAVVCLRESLELAPGLAEAQFLQGAANLNLGDEQAASNCWQPIVRSSLLDFDRYLGKHRHLLRPVANARWLPIVRQLCAQSGCDILLDEACRQASFSEHYADAGRFLEMSLRYGGPSSPGYAQRCAAYLKQVIDLLQNANSVYSAHHAFAILDHALEIIPDHPDLLYYRADFGAKTGFSPEQAQRDLDRCLQLRPNHVKAKQLKEQWKGK